MSGCYECGVTVTEKDCGCLVYVQSTWLSHGADERIEPDTEATRLCAEHTAYRAAGGE